MNSGIHIKCKNYLLNRIGVIILPEIFCPGDFLYPAGTTKQTIPSSEAQENTNPCLVFYAQKETFQSVGVVADIVRNKVALNGSAGALLLAYFSREDESNGFIPTKANADAS